MAKQIDLDKEIQKQLPDPIESIYDAGFSVNLMRQESLSTPVAQPLVDTNASIDTSAITEFLNALEVDQYIQLTHTTESSGASFAKTTQIEFKDQQKLKAPIALVYLRTGSGYDTTYNQLPFYAFPYTPGSADWLALAVHKYTTQRRFIEIETRTISQETVTYDIYILRDKINRENG